MEAETNILALHVCLGGAVTAIGASNGRQEFDFHHPWPGPCGCPGASHTRSDRVLVFGIGTNRHHSSSHDSCTRNDGCNQAAFNVGVGAV